MNNTVESKSQELVDTFNDVTGDDKEQAIVVVSTLEDDADKLLICCAGTPSMIMSIQATALAQNFDYMVKDNSIENPVLLMKELITMLMDRMGGSVAQSKGISPELYKATGKH